MLRFALTIFLFACLLPLRGQVVFTLDFEQSLTPAGWTSEAGEWGQAIGEDGSRYFRFHPASWRDALESPGLELASGYYVMYYSWNEAGTDNPDLCNIRLRTDGGDWETIAQTGGGNNRTWQRDSAVLGNLEAGTYAIQLEYQSLPRFPSQYFNLDNVRLERRSDVITSTTPTLAEALLEVTPVPARERMTLRLADKAGRVFDASLYSMGGQLLWNKTRLATNAAHTMAVDGIAAGPYLLKISHPDGSLTRKILIQ